MQTMSVIATRGARVLGMALKINNQSVSGVQDRLIAKKDIFTIQLLWIIFYWY